jgi:hypothetical protein
MSKKTSAKKPAKVLTIEFAGISTLIWNKNAGTADVHLVDLASAGFERHYAALSCEVNESTRNVIKGPSADVSLALGGREVDLGAWNLLGTTVELIGATGTLTVDDSKADVTKKPTKQARSVRWLANVGQLCESNALSPVCPTAAIIRLPAGHVTATGAAASRKLEFTSDGVPIEPDRFCLTRVQVEVPFETQLAIRISRERILRFLDSMKVTISNTCVCGLGQGEPANHFFAHYDVVEAKRRPNVKRAGKTLQFASLPEYCLPAYVQI